MHSAVYVGHGMVISVDTVTSNTGNSGNVGRKVTHRSIHDYT